VDRYCFGGVVVVAGFFAGGLVVVAGRLGAVTAGRLAEGAFAAGAATPDWAL
jgi:hypothetical protein